MASRLHWTPSALNDALLGYDWQGHLFEIEDCSPFVHNGYEFRIRHTLAGDPSVNKNFWGITLRQCLKFCEEFDPAAEYDEFLQKKTT